MAGESNASTSVSEVEVRRLLEKRPEKTRTYRVSPEVLRSIERDTGSDLRLLEEPELGELAEYLGVDRNELTGDFRVVDATLPGLSSSPLVPRLRAHRRGSAPA